MKKINTVMHSLIVTLYTVLDASKYRMTARIDHVHVPILPAYLGVHVKYRDRTLGYTRKLTSWSCESGTVLYYKSCCQDSQLFVVAFKGHLAVIFTTAQGDLISSGVTLAMD